MRRWVVKLYVRMGGGEGGGGGNKAGEGSDGVMSRTLMMSCSVPLRLRSAARE